MDKIKDRIELIQQGDKFFVMEYDWKFNLKSEYGFRYSPAVIQSHSRANAIKKYEIYNSNFSDVDLSVSKDGKLREISSEEAEVIRQEKIGLIDSLKEKIFGKTTEGITFVMDKTIVLNNIQAIKKKQEEKTVANKIKP